MPNPRIVPPHRSKFPFSTLGYAPPLISAQSQSKLIGSEYRSCGISGCWKPAPWAGGDCSGGGGPLLSCPKPVSSANEVNSIGSPALKSVFQPGGAVPGDGLVLDIGLKPCPSPREGGDKSSLVCRGVGVFALAVCGRGVCADEEPPWVDIEACGFPPALALVLEPLGLLACDDSAFFRFRRPAFSFSALSIITLLMRSNSEQIPSIRCTPPVSTSWPRADKNCTTIARSLVSERARGSRGFWRMLPNKVTSAETGKYNTILVMIVSGANS